MLKDFRLKPVVIMLILILLAGCSGIGPGSVERDRFDYVNALSSSWKKQILLNLVKIRYLDAPVFLDVTSVISQYAVEGKIDLGASWNDPILGLNPDAKEIRVVYGAFAADDQEIAMLTRSMLQIMIELASYIDVPAKDIDEGRVAKFSDRNATDMPPLIRIQSGASHPKDALVSIRYRDNWFWIDDTDLDSKRVFSFLMMLFSLTETGDKSGAPIVTVPTN
jgi:hypothetical protein